MELLLIGFAQLLFSGGAAWLGWFLRAKTEKSIQHGFDRELETLRSELRRYEETARLAQQDQRDAISTLRSSALSRLSTRSAALDQRRMEAAQALWESAVELKKLAFFVQMAGSLRLDTMLERAESGKPDSDGLRQMASTLLDSSGPHSLPDFKIAENKRVFITPLAWALFSALRSAYSLPLTYLSAIKAGVPSSVLKQPSETLQPIRLALPDWSVRIDELGIHILPYAVQKLEEELLKELNESLVGYQRDGEEVQRATRILAAVETFDRTQTSVSIPDDLLRQ